MPDSSPGGTASGYSTAVDLSAGGFLTNEAAGTIIGSADGFLGGSAAAAPVLNSGTIRGYGAVGAVLYGGGYVSNASGGTIAGSSEGIDGASTVINAGTISGRIGILLGTSTGEYVSNASGASIIGGISGGNASVVNAGLVTGGMGLYAGSFLTNEATGTIAGSNVSFSGGGTPASTILNSGTIEDPSGGVFVGGYATAGGSISYLSNASTATIIGQIQTGGPVSVVNAGLVAGVGCGGVSMFGGGFLTNEATGTISEAAGTIGSGGYSDAGFYCGPTGASTVLNAGTIESVPPSVGSAYAASYGISLDGGGFVSNSAHALIYGVSGGVRASLVAATVVNGGLISSGATSAAAVALTAGGLLVNQAGGTIRSAYFSGGTAVVEDFGTLGAVTLGSASSSYGYSTYNEAITVEAGVLSTACRAG